MYMVIHGAKAVGICDKPRWVSPQGEFGCFVQVSEEDATHVAVGGVAYDLTETSIKEVDGGEIAFDHLGRLTLAEEAVVESEDALCGLSTEIEKRVAEIEDALCEMSMD